MERYTVVARGDECSNRIEKYIHQQLENKLVHDNKNPQLVISVGGDGTVLHSIHKYMDTDCVFVGLHTGTLGFFTDYKNTQVDELIDDILMNKYTLSKRYLLDITLHTSTGIKTYHAVNEVRLDQGFTTQVMHVYINNTLLEVFRGNGLCISTPSGSTAYNRSLGGAVIYPSAPLMQVTEVAGIHHNAYRSLGNSLILDSEKVVTIESNMFNDNSMGIDYLSYPLKNVEKIDIQLSKKVITFIEYKEMSFIKRIRRAFIN